MKRYLTILLLLNVVAMTASAREVFPINEGWRFFFKSEKTSDNARHVTLPHSWNTDPLAQGYWLETTGSYQNGMYIPVEWASKRLFVKFYGVQSVADLFVNGYHVGTHRGGATAFTFEITGRIDVKIPGKNQPSTEQMVQYGKYVFVNCWSYQNRILKIDTETDRVVGQLTVGIQPASLAMDRNNKLWTVTDGGYEGSPYGYEAPSLYRIDAETFSVEKQFRFRKGDSPSEMQLNGTRDTLYWIDRDVWRMPVAGEQLPVRPFLEYRETKYYGLTVDPTNGDVYVADAIDYQQQGVVYRYTAKGEPVDEFHVGVAPGAFCWK